MARSSRTRAGAGDPALPLPTLSDSVLRLLWEERRISRAEIARRARLSRSTVSDIVGALLPTGLVAEAGVGASLGGRRPIVLEFQDDAFVILGVDVGASHISVVLTNLRGKVLDWHHQTFAVRSDPIGTWRLISDLCAASLASVGRKRARLLGIGMALPTPVDPRQPERLSQLSLPQWGGRLDLEQIRRRFNVPVLVDNDANLGALAERWWGGAQGLEDFAYIKVATGIGSGHFVGGRIYRGASGVAGEIGHMTIDQNGPVCTCGNRGCLQAHIGTRELLARVAALRVEYPASMLAEPPTIPALVDAALVDDPLALRVVTEIAEHLGVAVASMLNLMNPSAVIIGGGLARLGERLLQPLRERVRRRTFVSAVASADIRASQLGPQDIAMGAATLTLDAALTNPRLFPTVGAR